jgi:lambda repressor-like predicted transcriptional regulator
MSSKKITAADKLEIVNLYREAGDTTASLANRFGVSNSTISRILKTSIPEAEYEMLIQQKRGSKMGIEDEILATIAAAGVSARAQAIVESEIGDGTILDGKGSVNEPTNDLEDAPVMSNYLFTPTSTANTIEEESNVARRVRRRSSAPLTVNDTEPVVANSSVSLVDIDESRFTASTTSANPAATPTPPIKTPLPSPIPRTPVLREILADSEQRYSEPVIEPAFPDISADELEDDDDDDENTEDVNALAAMFGEEIADNDDDDEEDDDDDEEEESTASNRLLDPTRLLTKDRLHVQITPLSQATLPRTCYIVVDKFAELIVRPLKDFADLGQISGEETQQRTLPVFDNHRVAKRFSNQRTHRVIKVPDSRVFYKTTQHLRSKGITRLLVDGNIYSLN